MQSNTAQFENQPITFANFSVENKTYKPDSFTIRDGRYVGHDGFVVPKDFNEFHERFPQHVRNWVRKHADRLAQPEDLEDWAQHLSMHLGCLPATSKHREAGKVDIVETFDADKHFGANEPRFLNYINLCLANKLRTLQSKRMKDALGRTRNLSPTGHADDGNSVEVDDEYCHAHSEFLRRAADVSEKQHRDRAFLLEFIEFVKREDPSVLPAIEAILATGTQGDAADFLEVTETLSLLGCGLE